MGFGCDDGLVGELVFGCGFGWLVLWLGSFYVCVRLFVLLVVGG